MRLTLIFQSLAYGHVVHFEAHASHKELVGALERLWEAFEKPWRLGGSPHKIADKDRKINKGFKDQKSLSLSHAFAATDCRLLPVASGTPPA